MASPFYTAEHEAYREVVRRFVQKEIEPYAHEWDEEGGFPRLHFSRKTLVETALRNTSAERMARVMAQLADAAFDMRKQSSLADVIAQRALLALAVNARRRG